MSDDEKPRMKVVDLGNPAEINQESLDKFSELPIPVQQAVIGGFIPMIAQFLMSCAAAKFKNPTEEAREFIRTGLDSIQKDVIAMCNSAIDRDLGITTPTNDDRPPPGSKLN